MQSGTRQKQLQVDEDRRFQEAWWTTERIAWIGFALIIILAVAGLTGLGGPLSQGSAAGPTGDLEFPRWSRWQADDHMRVGLLPTGKDMRTISLSQEFTDQFEVVDIEPRPVRSIAAAQMTHYEFAVDPQAEGHVDFSVRSLHPGMVSYYVAIDGDRLPASTFVWP